MSTLYCKFCDNEVQWVVQFGAEYLLVCHHCQEVISSVLVRIDKDHTVTITPIEDWLAEHQRGGLRW